MSTRSQSVNFVQPNLRQSASEIDVAKEDFPEYDQMFKDGVMQVTIGLGYDEQEKDVYLGRTVVSELERLGFQNVKSLSTFDLATRGIEPSSIDPEVTYFAKTLQHDGKDVEALVKLVDRNTPEAKGKFGESMKNDDLIIYCGHGRLGSGPDFDHANSPAGNYVIGEPLQPGKYELGENDLTKPEALGNHYQLMFFDACNTINYVDDLRSRPANKNSQNLDLLVSTRDLSWGTSRSDIFAMLEGVMARKSIQNIKDELDRLNALAGEGDAFMADGFDDNTYLPKSDVS